MEHIKLGKMRIRSRKDSKRNRQFLQDSGQNSPYPQLKKIIDRMEKKLRSNPSSMSASPKEEKKMKRPSAHIIQSIDNSRAAKAQSMLDKRNEMSISSHTYKENRLIEILLHKEKTSNGSPTKDIDIGNDETSKNLFVQKKEMRHMRQQISSVLYASIQNQGFDAFDIEDEAIDKIVEKISFDENESMIKQGRLLIKNRIKRFNIIVNKSKGL